MATDVSTSSARATMKASSRPVISWGAIFGGAVVGLALLALLSALWLALAFESQMDVVRSNLEWYIGGSALACLFLGGLITGYLAGIRSLASGVLHAWALWGLILIATVALGIPSVLNIFGLGRVTSELDGGVVTNANALWASFWTILGGFLAAGLGGAIGGAFAREPGVKATTTTAGTTADADDAYDAHHARVE
jgi:hypothetical protein